MIATATTSKTKATSEHQDGHDEDSKGDGEQRKAQQRRLKNRSRTRKTRRRRRLRRDGGSEARLRRSRWKIGHDRIEGGQATSARANGETEKKTGSVKGFNNEGDLDSSFSSEGDNNMDQRVYDQAELTTTRRQSRQVAVRQQHHKAETKHSRATRAHQEQKHKGHETSGGWRR